MEAALQPLAEKEIYKRPEPSLGDGISDGICDDVRGIDAAESFRATPPTRGPTVFPLLLRVPAI